MIGMKSVPYQPCVAASIHIEKLNIIPARPQPKESMDHPDFVKKRTTHCALAVV